MQQMERSYLDWNATAPLRPEARAAMVGALDLSGNASSVHAEGRAARHTVEQAREAVAALVGAEPRNVIFTSGGTEANTMALTPGLRRGTGLACQRLLVSAIEHPSVLAGGRFAPDAVESIPVTADGVVDLAWLARRLAPATGSPGPALVSIMLANNETGVVQPVREAAALVHAAGGLLHVDAVQAAGRMEVDINEFEADLLTISGHKIGAPKGVGALVKRDGSLHFADPLIRGGGQERGARAGTENVAGLAGFGAAAAAVRRTLASERALLLALRERLETGLREIDPGVAIFGGGQARIPNTVLFATAGIKAETAVIRLDLDGIAVSSGSACSSGKITRSHVLAAMRVPADLAHGAVRASFGCGTRERDIDRLLQAWRTLTETLPKQQREIAA